MSVTDWCFNGKHKECPQSWQRWYIDPRTSKVVWLDEYHTCGCRKRGCPCYVKPADRPKPVKRKTRRKK